MAVAVSINLFYGRGTRICVSMLVGICFLLRCSEHVGAKTATAVLLTRKHVTFFDYNGHAISYRNVWKIAAHSLALNIEFSKTDLSGFGRTPIIVYTGCMHSVYIGKMD